MYSVLFLVHTQERLQASAEPKHARKREKKYHLLGEILLFWTGTDMAPKNKNQKTKKL